MSEQEQTPETIPTAAKKDESGGNLLAVAMASVALCLGGYAFYQTQFGQVQPVFTWWIQTVWLRPTSAKPCSKAVTRIRFCCNSSWNKT